MKNEKERQWERGKEDIRYFFSYTSVIVYKIDKQPFKAWDGNRCRKIGKGIGLWSYHSIILLHLTYCS